MAIAFSSAPVGQLAVGGGIPAFTDESSNATTFRGVAKCTDRLPSLSALTAAATAVISGIRGPMPCVSPRGTLRKSRIAVKNKFNEHVLSVVYSFS